MKIINKLDVECLFQAQAEKHYGQKQDLKSISEELSKLKFGGALTYQHLRYIDDKNKWPFCTWWQWPPEAQIREPLKKTEGLFTILAKLPKEHEKRFKQDKDIFEFLYFKVFKHLELVSIILRFVDEENFAIHSPPVAQIINSPRGYSYSLEYLNYLEELRNYGRIYSLPKVAYVDLFLWTIALGRQNSERTTEQFHREIDEARRAKVVRAFLKEKVINKPEREKARFYTGLEEFDTAAKWAGIAFEKQIRRLCVKREINLLNSDGTRKTLDCLLTSLLDYEQIKYRSPIFEIKMDLKKTKRLRNDAMHPPGKKFDLEIVNYMISIATKIERID